MRTTTVVLVDILANNVASKTVEIIIPESAANIAGPASLA